MSEAVRLLTVESPTWMPSVTVTQGSHPLSSIESEDSVRSAPLPRQFRWRLTQPG